jgi:hypothetical protein
MAVANGDGDGPAVAIVRQEVLHAEGQVCGEEGFHWGERLPLTGLFSGGGREATDHDHTHQMPRQDCPAEAHPGLALGAGRRGMGHQAW